MITPTKYDSLHTINIHALWSHFHLHVCLLLMKKMKRPADLMNSAVRITTASQTTGGVTARMTAETTQTRRTAVSTWLLHFLSALFVRLYTLFALYTYFGSEEFPLWRHLSAPPTTTTTLSHSQMHNYPYKHICNCTIVQRDVSRYRLNSSLFQAQSYYL